MADARNTVNVPVPGSARFQQDTAMAIGRLKAALGPSSSPSFASTDFTAITVGGSTVSAALIGQWNTAYGWGDHAGLYDAVGASAGEIGDHEMAYDHTLLHSPVTIPVSANGLVLTGQEISFPTTAIPQFYRLKIEGDGTSQFISPTYPPLECIRTVTGATDRPASFLLHAKTSADMADGFGVLMEYAIQDSAEVRNAIGAIGFQRAGADNTGNFVIYTRSAGSSSLKATVTSSGRLGLGISAPEGLAHFYQSSTTGAIPVLWLHQRDFSEEFVRFQGTAAASNIVNSIVAVASVTTATVAGYVRVYVQDDGDQITDQAYYMPIYTLA